MATYMELKGLETDSDLQAKVEVAIWVWAEAVLGEGVVPDHDKRVTLARRAFAAPRGTAAEVLPAVLAANKAVSVAGIQGASDAAVQAAVNTALDTFAPDLKVAGTD